MNFKNAIAVSQTLVRIQNMASAANENRNSTPANNTFEDEENEENDDDNIWAHHKKAVQASRKQVGTDTSSDELKHYLNQPVIQLNEDPIKYWQRQKLLYPTLSRVAERFLCMVATSVPSERLFSRAGNIITDNRSRLLGDRLSRLVFLNTLPYDNWCL